MNKNVKDISEHTIIFSITYDGEPIIINEDIKRALQLGIKKELKAVIKGGYKLQVKVLKVDTVIFQRGRKPKKFSPEQCKEIRENGLSYRENSMKYNTSTRTIWEIKKGKY